MDTSWAWWSILATIGSFNLIAGIIIFIKSKNSSETAYSDYRKKMRILGIIYIFVAAYRSFFVSGYLYQLAWFNSILNNSLLIRFFAWFAEVSFALIIMNAYFQLNKDVPNPYNKESGSVVKFIENQFPFFAFLCVFTAQFFANTATITKFVTLFAIEETLWGIAFLFILPVSILELKKVFSFKDEKSKSELKLYRIFTVMLAVFTIGYVAYSVCYHLPLEYWPYAVDQFQGGTMDPVIRTGWAAVKDAFFNINVTKDYNTWGGIGFVIWYTGYFSLCVWMVLFMMNGPRKIFKDKK